ncbi:uncharacterized protein LOC110190289 isoform X1 [Drosophila serrata]|uniref:uncharacterized protein LOC110190289 isoform X1 n=1 Tax=Drosophila serrata TaxID=7274 RepID=UPI000A1CF5F8|nr:uncharacterized protein LOC110190289 isoform X1 [Drosophila serrata]
MNLLNMLLETDSMVKMVTKDAEQWQQSIQGGRLTMKQVKTINLQIFDTENQLNSRDSRRYLQTREKRINYLFERLQQPLWTMNQILKTLTRIRDNTDRMHNRLALWMDDPNVAKHKIASNLRSPELLELLDFLSGRYSAEWEVKEVVVRDLEHINNAKELDFFVEAWSICRHSDGYEFQRLLGDFYDKIGRRNRFLMPAP